MITRIYIPPSHPQFRKLKKRKSQFPHFQHLGGFLPILKGRKTSKIKPEFVIFDPLRGEFRVVKTNIQSIKVQMFFDIFCHLCHLFVNFEIFAILIDKNAACELCRPWDPWPGWSTFEKNKDTKIEWMRT